MNTRKRVKKNNNSKTLKHALVQPKHYLNQKEINHKQDTTKVRRDFFMSLINTNVSK